MKYFPVFCLLWGLLLAACRDGQAPAPSSDGGVYAASPAEPIVPKNSLPELGILASEPLRSNSDGPKS